MISKFREPVKPGEILLNEFLIPMGISQVELAAKMNVPVQRVNTLINGKRDMTPETAVLLSLALGTSAQFWMNLQVASDIYKTQKTLGLNVGESIQEKQTDLRPAINLNLNYNDMDINKILTLKEIGNSILERLKAEMEKRVRFPSIGRAYIQWGKNDNELHWLVRSIATPPNIGRDFVGNPITITEGQPTTLDENEISRDSKLGGLLLQQNLGEVSYSLNQKSINLKIENLSLFEPAYIQNIDAINGLIKSIEFDYNFKSLARELKEWKQILEAELQFEPDSSIKEELIQSLKQFTEELLLTKEKKKRYAILGAQLRDRPFLDPVQDNIKRSKIFDGSMIISGGPGTGKTTSLIQRITFLTSNTVEEYKTGLTPSDLSIILDRNKSWLFISPTELLRLYLKNIMAKESLNADNDRVVVWESYRRLIFRRMSLINPDTQRPFQAINSAAQFFKLDSAKLKNLLKQFESFLISSQNVKIQAVLSIQTKDVEWTALAEEVKVALEKRNEINTIVKFAVLFEDIKNKFVNRAKTIIETYNKALDDTTANCHLKIDRDLEKKDVLETLIKEMKTKLSPDIDTDNEEEDEEETITTPIFNMKNEINKIIKRIIRKTFLRKLDSNVKLTPFENEVNEIIANLINKDQIRIISEGALFNKHFNRILRGFEVNILREIPQVYKTFRKEFKTLNIVTLEGNELIETIMRNNPRKIHREEMDLILLIIFSFIHRIYNESKNLYNNSDHIYFKEFRELTKTVIAIDEAPDFNILQLVCISHLSHPRFQSVTLSGDIMQSLDSNGLTNWHEYISFFPGTELNELNVSYRQTSKLLEIAKVIYKHNTEKDLAINSAYDVSDYEPDPLVIINGNFEEKIKWIADRIHEIHVRYDNSLPSIAIFLKNDDELNKYAKALNETDILSNSDIKSVACPNGEILGDSQNVRIFNIKYIKGMEFEAVFYIDIDTLEEEQRKIVDRFLYVGLSRASSYLAITLNKAFPDNLLYIKDSFIEGKDWE